MKCLPLVFMVVRARVCARLAVYSFAVLALVCAASAAPISYTGFTITDGKLGTWEFHNARVYLTFVSDTSNVQFMQVPDPTNPACQDPTNPQCSLADIYMNQKGEASVTIIAGEKAVHAEFMDKQIFVANDLGTTGRTNTLGGRGIAFGSFSPTMPGGIDPLYPLAIADGTADWGDYVTSPSPELFDLALDLKHRMGLSGRAASCSGFIPNTGSLCPTPPALKTDKGDFYLFERYRTVGPGGDLLEPFGDPLGAGFFLAEVGTEREEAHNPVALTASKVANAKPNSNRPITYNAYVISDVTIGEHHYKGAEVYLSFEADASSAVPVNAHGFINATGSARVTVIRGEDRISADFAPGQIYVFYDEDTASIGFGSYVGGKGYPLTLTGNQDLGGLTENSSIGAVSDLLLFPADASNYTAATANLSTDLKNETVLGGAASSCISFNPITSVCANLNPIPLHTNRGNFYLFEPYTQNETANNGTGPFSINWGIFWSELGTD